MLYDISYIIGAVNGQHIHVLVMVVGGIPHEIVELVCMLWDFEFY